MIKVKSFHVFITACLLLLFVLAGCGQVKSPGSTPEKKFITVTDSKGRQVKVSCPPERIVAIGGSYGPETLLAFGVQDKIVGVADYEQTAKLRGLGFHGLLNTKGLASPNALYFLSTSDLHSTMEFDSRPIKEKLGR